MLARNRNGREAGEPSGLPTLRGVVPVDMRHTRGAQVSTGLLEDPLGPILALSPRQAAGAQCDGVAKPRLRDPPV